MNNVENLKGKVWLKFFMYFFLLYHSLHVGWSVVLKSSKYAECGFFLRFGLITLAISFCILGVYAFIALYRRWKNAVYLARVYLYVVLLVYGIVASWSLIVADEEERMFLLPIFACILLIIILWLLYFNYSKLVNKLFPKEEREFNSRDYYILAVLIAIPSLSFIISMI